MSEPKPEVFVQLGKYGDLMILFPGLKAIYEATGVKPVVYVAAKFVDLFDGISYATPVPMKLDWWRDVQSARAFAFAEHGHCHVGKWWDMPGAEPPPNLEDDSRLRIGINIHGQWRTLMKKDWDSYQSSQWRAFGFTMKQFFDWPLVFDRRDEAREAELRKLHFKTGKPKLLVNLCTLGTSPFPYEPEVFPILREANAEIVDLRNVRAHRLYDLLGLYDSADGLVTSDTSTLHLAGASKIRYLAFINNGGAGSVPKGNCLLKLRYDEILVRGNPERIRAVLRGVFP